MRRDPDLPVLLEWLRFAHQAVAESTDSVYKKLLDGAFEFYTDSQEQNLEILTFAAFLVTSSYYLAKHETFDRCHTPALDEFYDIVATTAAQISGVNSDEIDLVHHKKLMNLRYGPYEEALNYGIRQLQEQRNSPRERPKIDVPHLGEVEAWDTPPFLNLTHRFILNFRGRDPEDILEDLPGYDALCMCLYIENCIIALWGHMKESISQ